MAELIVHAGGHTESDAVLFLPQDGIAFMSALLFIGRQPHLGGGDPDRLCYILGKVSALAPKVLVPGHGPLGTMVENGQAQEAIDTMTTSAPYDVVVEMANNTALLLNPDSGLTWSMEARFADSRGDLPTI